VTVKIEDVTELYGFEFNVTWNSTMLKLVHVEFTNQLNQVWSNWQAVINETDGAWYRLVAVALKPAAGFNGTATLAKLTFRIEYGPCYIEPNYQIQTRIHFSKVKLSDSSANPICAQVYDGKYIIYAVKPGLKITPQTVTCRKLNETFVVEVKVIDAFKAFGFNIQISYNTTLLHPEDVQWGDLSVFLPGPYIIKEYAVDESNGIIYFHIVENVSAGAPLAFGDGVLARITFKVIETKMWKNCPEWINSISSSISFTDWNITVMCPTVHYLTGELVNTVEANYTFLPIQGDINFDGQVDIFDLSTVALYYDLEEGDPRFIADYDLNCDGIIDLFDLVLVALNFGFEYDC